MNALRRIRGSLCALAAFGWLLCGCATWSPPTDSKSPLQKPKLASDSVVLDYRFVDIPAEFPLAEWIGWPGVDEQQIDADIRRRLDENGIRCGVVGEQLPSWLYRLLEQPAKSVDELVSDVADGNVLQRSSTLQCRAGKVTRIVVTSTPKAEMPVLMHDEGTVRGMTYRDAQGVLELKAWPLGDRRAQIELLPEIEYGKAHQRWIGQEGMFILDASREKQKFEPLRIRATLDPGQVLVVGSSDMPRGLGASFFSDTTARGLTSSEGLRRRLLLIRFSDSIADDLFVPEEERAPLVPDSTE